MAIKANKMKKRKDIIKNRSSKIPGDISYHNLDSGLIGRSREPVDARLLLDVARRASRIHGHETEAVKALICVYRR
jgi:hypothetical protein